jgi:hypothetical protein
MQFLNGTAESFVPAQWRGQERHGKMEAMIGASA